MKILEPVAITIPSVLTEKRPSGAHDSGGLQEESTYFRTPCLTLRPNTERPITITMGSNRLTQPDRLSSDIQEMLAGNEQLGQVPPLWDGKASERIVQALAEQHQVS